MNRLHQTLLSGIHDETMIFVFPSDVVATMWADALLEKGETKAVAMERFIPWDTFKEKSIKSKVSGKSSTSAVVRKLFAESLIAKNAREPFFASLIPPRYAQNAAHFAPWLSALLPSLAGWNEAYAKSGDGDDEDRDLHALFLQYNRFLQENNLFEPAWEKPPMQHTEFSYTIFFPELIEDFCEYESLLRRSSEVTIVRMEEDARAKPLSLYTDTRSELKALVGNILHLHQNGTPYTDIAVSVGDLDTIEPYVLREFMLHDVPIHIRSGKMLGATSVGRFFSLAEACVKARFSFASLKALLLFAELPWKEKELNRELISFGQNHNCFCSYKDEGVWQDVWEYAFKSEWGEERLSTYYAELKHALTALTNAKDFDSVRRFYFAFRTRFFNEEEFSERESAVMGRCLSELAVLMQTERDFPSVKAENPFSFFVKILDGTKYQPQSESAGVSVFPYRVACAAPFKHHFVINASQDNVKVLYRPLSFLPQYKRDSLNMVDTDASNAFLSLYESEDTAVTYSAATKTFSGYTMPHGFFLGNIIEEKPIAPQRDGAVGGGNLIKGNPVLAPQPVSAQTADSADSAEAAASLTDTPPKAKSQERAETCFAETCAAAPCAAETRAASNSSAATPCVASDSTETCVAATCAASDAAPCAADLFDTEKAWWQNPNAPFVPTVHGVQKRGFDTWYALRKKPLDSTNEVWAQLDKRLHEKAYGVRVWDQDGTDSLKYAELPRVSASTLKNYIACPTQWLFNRVCDIKEFTLEASIMDDDKMGLLYHEILQKLMIRIRQKDRVLCRQNFDTYAKWIDDITAESVRAAKAFQSPLASSLLQAQINSISGVLKRFFARMVASFDSFLIVSVEGEKTVAAETYVLTGRIDCVLAEPGDGGGCIIDYKTAKLPAKKDCFCDEDGNLFDFQMPVYLTLYEENNAQKKDDVKTAVFLSIKKDGSDGRRVVLGSMIDGTSGKIAVSKKASLDTERAKTYETAARFANAVASLNFTPNERIPYDTCTQCPYKTVCRTTYTVSGEKECHIAKQ